MAAVVLNLEFFPARVAVEVDGTKPPRLVVEVDAKALRAMTAATPPAWRYPEDGSDLTRSLAMLGRACVARAVDKSRGGRVR